MIDSIRESWVTANSLNFHLILAGDSNQSPVMFLHGFPEFSYSWRKQVPTITNAGYYAIAPDLRGYHLTEKPRNFWNYHLSCLMKDVVELGKALVKGPVTIVGHDWGGLIAWYLAMYYPSFVSKLIVLNSPHPAIFFRKQNLRQLKRSWYILFFQIPWLPEYLIVRNAKTIVEWMCKTAVRKEAFTETDLQIYAHAIKQPGAMSAAINYYRALMYLGWRLRIQSIKAPTLLIWAKNDVALGIELTNDTNRYVKNLEIAYIEDCGHWVQQEAANQVNDLILAFLKQAF